MPGPDVMPVAPEKSATIPAIAVEGGRLAMLLTAVGVAIRLRLDPDLWGHLRFGLDLLDSGHLTSIDPYSFAQDVPWINHEWLSELLTAVAYRAAGVGGLIALKGLILGAAFAVAALLTRQVRPDLRGWLLAAAFIGTFPMAATMRPQLWTILGVCVLSAILTGRIRLRWMPLLFAVWANMHGGWIVGFGITGLWALGRLLDTRDWRRLAPLAIAATASLVATLANPYGWRLWVFLATTVRMSRPDITEWRPYWEGFEPQHIALWPLSAAILVVALFTRWRAVRWATLLPALWLMASGVMVARLAPIGSLAVLFVAVDAWRSRSDGEAREQPATVRPPRARYLIDAAVLAAVSVPVLVSESRCLPLTDPWAPDVVAAGALAAPDVTGRLVVPFNWGEYAIWHFGPGLRVSMDGRRETVYSQAAIERHVALMKAEAQGLDYLDRVRPEYAWLTGSPDRSALAQQILERGYRIDVQTVRSFVMVRGDLPGLASGPPLSGCFP